MYSQYSKKKNEFGVRTNLCYYFYNSILQRGGWDEKRVLDETFLVDFSMYIRDFFLSNPHPRQHNCRVTFYFRPRVNHGTHGFFGKSSSKSYDSKNDVAPKVNCRQSFAIPLYDTVHSDDLSGSYDRAAFQGVL